ncbi:uncharacterized protein LOC135209979 [Macrobrachium nipponense]|uniref:uncharacterized protein LOC135209979 n=1 Tax=Macrobrachium nipponense TaxID=159736 RepID=UPI0030C82032
MTDTKRKLLIMVKNSVMQRLAEAEGLVGENISVRGSELVNDDRLVVDDNGISGGAGFSLFDDPPQTGVIYEGPANLPPRGNITTNPFLTEENLGPAVPTMPVNSESKEIQEYDLICKKIELLKLEHAENERVRRHEIEMANLNLEMARLQGATNQFSTPRGSQPDRFNIGAALKLVPIFDERNVPEFFKAFERVSARLSWPPEMWTVLIQCKLVGKAIRVYNALEEGIARDYHKVKALILKAYDLVPEAYRLKFRNFNKQPSLSYVEFARFKEEQFDDWLKSRQVVTFSSLRELMLLEEFKKSCSKELRIYLEELKVTNLGKAAQVADEFVLTHRTGSGNFASKDINSNVVRSENFHRGIRSDINKSKNSVAQNNFSSSKNGKFTSKPGTRVFSKGGSSGTRNSNIKTCFWCNKPGHFQAQCHARTNYLQRNNPVALMPSASPDVKLPIINSGSGGNSTPGEMGNNNPQE